MLFGALHGVLLLPVLLSLTDVCGGKKKTNKFPNSHLKNQLNSPFYSSKKHFDGTTILHNGTPIYIPRPSFTDLNNEGAPVSHKNSRKNHDEDSGKASKSSSSSDGSVVAENLPDLGLGTSAEECSEGSWKVVKASKEEEIVIEKEFDVPRISKEIATNNIYANIYKDWTRYSANRGNAGDHVNSGYVSDVNPDVEYYHHLPPPTQPSTSKPSTSPFMAHQSHRMSLYHQVEVATDSSSERNRWERKSAPVPARANKNKNKTYANPKYALQSSNAQQLAQHYKRHRDRDGNGQSEMRQQHVQMGKEKERRSSSSDNEDSPPKTKKHHQNSKYHNGSSHHR